MFLYTNIIKMSAPHIRPEQVLPYMCKSCQGAGPGGTLPHLPPAATPVLLDKPAPAGGEARGRAEQESVTITVHS